MNTRLISASIISLLLFAGCRPEEEKVSSEEAVKFITEIEKGYAAHQLDFINSHIILPALMNRISKIKKIEHAAAVEKGMKESLGRNEFEKNLFSVTGKKGSFEKVKQYEKDGKQRAVFRVFGDGGINYLDLELTKLENRVGIADMFVYVSGENISTTMSELYIKLKDRPEYGTESVSEKMQMVRRYMKTGSHKQAKKEFDQLPASFRETKAGETMNLQILSGLDQDEYLAAIKKYEQKYMGDPSIQLTLLDMYILLKDYDKSMSVINQIDSMINKDSFLDYYRGLISNLKGEVGNALVFFEKVTMSNPGFPGAYAELFAIYAEKGEKQKAKKYFTLYKTLKNADENITETYGMLYPWLLAE